MLKSDNWVICECYKWPGSYFNITSQYKQDVLKSVHFIYYKGNMNPRNPWIRPDVRKL